MKFIKKYNLELMSVFLLIFMVISVFTWGSLSWQQRIMTVYMLLLTLHEWEETRYPGGFYEMMLTRLTNGEELTTDAKSLHIFTACMVILAVLPGWIFGSFRPFLMIPVCLGCLEGCMHTAAIFIFHRKIPYSPGLCTALLMLATSVVTLISGFGGGLVTVGSLLLGLLFMIILFAVFMQLTLRQMGFSLPTLIKRIK